MEFHGVVWKGRWSSKAQKAFTFFYEILLLQKINDIMGKVFKLIFSKNYF